mgnify:CR=1 FL=1
MGFIEITDPRAPRPLGTVLAEGEPTAVVTLRGTAFAGVNTSASFTEPSGRLAVIDIATRELPPGCDLGGQPDSLAIAPDASFTAVAVENERDADLGDGGLPQLPAGARSPSRCRRTTTSWCWPRTAPSCTISRPARSISSKSTRPATAP